MDTGAFVLFGSLARWSLSFECFISVIVLDFGSHGAGG